MLLQKNTQLINCDHDCDHEWNSRPLYYKTYLDFRRLEQVPGGKGWLVTQSGGGTENTFFLSNSLKFLKKLGGGWVGWKATPPPRALYRERFSSNNFTPAARKQMKPYNILKSTAVVCISCYKDQNIWHEFDFKMFLIMQIRESPFLNVSFLVLISAHQYDR